MICATTIPACTCASNCAYRNEMKSAFFCDITQRRTVSPYRRFRTTYVPSLSVQQSRTLRNILDERRSHVHRGGSLKSRRNRNVYRILRVTARFEFIAWGVSSCRRFHRVERWTVSDDAKAIRSFETSVTVYQ